MRCYVKKGLCMLMTVMLLMFCIAPAAVFAEDEKPNTLITLLWCLLLIILPIALVFSESSMNNIQSVSIISAFPIGIIMILMIWSFMKDAEQYLKETR